MWLMGSSRYCFRKRNQLNKGKGVGRNRGCLATHAELSLAGAMVSFLGDDIGGSRVNPPQGPRVWWVILCCLSRGGTTWPGHACIDSVASAKGVGVER